MRNTAADVVSSNQTINSRESPKVYGLCMESVQSEQSLQRQFQNPYLQTKACSSSTSYFCYTFPSSFVFLRLIFSFFFDFLFLSQIFALSGSITLYVSPILVSCSSILLFHPDPSEITPYFPSFFLGLSWSFPLIPATACPQGCPLMGSGDEVCHSRCHKLEPWPKAVPLGCAL